MVCQSNLIKRLLFLFVLLLLTITISSTESDINQNKTWHIETGDSATYVYTKVFYYYSKNRNQLNTEHTTNDGRSVSILITKGSIKTYTILNVTNINVNVKININKNITLKETSCSGYRFPIRKTISSKNYWENYYEDWASIKVSGNLIIREYSLHDNIWNTYELEKWNWKTGWSIYSYKKIWNVTTVVFEQEQRIISSPIFFPSNMFFGGIILFIIISILITTHKWQKIKNINFKQKKELW